MDKKEQGDNQSGEIKEAADRREFVRFPVDLRLKFKDPKTNEEKEVLIRDISAKGIGIWSDEELNSDTFLEMRIEILDHGQVSYDKGRVVWSTLAGPNKYKAGICLGKVDLIGVSLILRAAYGTNWL